MHLQEPRSESVEVGDPEVSALHAGGAEVRGADEEDPQDADAGNFTAAPWCYYWYDHCAHWWSNSTESPGRAAREVSG